MLWSSLLSSDHHFFLILTSIAVDHARRFVIGRQPQLHSPIMVSFPPRTSVIGRARSSSREFHGSSFALRHLSLSRLMSLELQWETNAFFMIGKGWEHSDNHTLGSRASHCFYGFFLLLRFSSLWSHRITISERERAHFHSDQLKLRLSSSIVSVAMETASREERKTTVASIEFNLSPCLPSKSMNMIQRANSDRTHIVFEGALLFISS